MATFTENIRIVVDLVTTKAQSGIRDMRTEMAKAETGFGKIKAAGSSALGSVASSATLTATAVTTAAGAAIAFGKRAVEAFQDVALSAKKMSDATGLSVESASQLNEVASDLGISTETITSAVGKMNKALVLTPEAFSAIGAEIVKTKDGTTDVAGTFLNTVDALNAIPDPATKAAAAAKILGKGWQESAELLALGGDAIRQLMDDVSDAKTVTDDEAAAAVDLRAKLDRLKDSVQDLQIETGEALVPTLAELANNLATIIEVADDLGSHVGLLKGDVVDMVVSYLPGIQTIKLFGDALDGQVSAWGRVKNSLSDVIPPLRLIPGLHREAADSAKGQAVSTVEVANALDIATAAMNNLLPPLRTTAADVHGLGTAFVTSADLINGALARLDLEDAAARNKQALEDLRAKALIAWDAAAHGAEDAAEKQGDYDDALRESKRNLLVQLGAVNDYDDALAGLPTEQVTEITALIDEGSLDEAERRLEILQRNRTMELSIVLKGGAGFGTLHGGAFAEGGDIPPGTTGLTGEAGAELLSRAGRSVLVTGPTLARGPAHVTPLSAMRAFAPVTVNVNLPAGADSDSRVVGSIQRWARRNGAIPAGSRN